MLNEQIKKLRILNGMSQVDLAARLGISKQSVSNWENDNIQPSIDMLLKLARLFSVSTDYLLGLETRRYLEVSGLSETQLTHLQQIIDDLVRANNGQTE
ncbi:MAG: helix-turn-helix transcriptional regulator [Spirochaetia bacterium]|nr:helix-turn-helix transcriptional regulator [Spirochaetia bacterium]